MSFSSSELGTYEGYPQDATRLPTQRVVTTSPYRGLMEHYANCFCLLSNQCFRMIQAGDGTGHAQHCLYLTERRGRFRDRPGKWHTVEACDGHGADLDTVQRIG